MLRPLGPVLAVLQHILNMGEGWLRRKLIQKELEGSLRPKGYRNQMQCVGFQFKKQKQTKHKTKTHKAATI